MENINYLYFQMTDPFRAAKIKEEQRMKRTRLIALLLAILMVAALAGCAAKQAPASAEAGQTAEEKDVTYYYIGVNNNHPYWYDVHQGFEYAAEQLGVRVVKSGVDGWDPQGQAAALEQAITKNPDGIIVPVFDASMLPGLKAAKEAGIPVVAIESTMEDAEVVSYIGLDNYDSGKQTAKQLIEYGGDGGKVVIMGNWEIIAKLDDKAVTETAIEQAKAAFNNYPEMTAIIGLDSSSGAGIGAAMEELGKEPGSITVVVHDREVLTLEYIEKGYLNCTMVNKTASMPFLALQILEGIVKHNMQGLPISADNAASGVNAVPEVCYNGTVVITQDNVENFMVSNMTAYDSEYYG